VQAVHDFAKQGAILALSARRRMKFVANLLVAINNVAAASDDPGRTRRLDPRTVVDMVGPGAAARGCFKCARDDGRTFMSPGDHEGLHLEKDMAIIAEFADDSAAQPLLL